MYGILDIDVGGFSIMYTTPVAELVSVESVNVLLASGNTCDLSEKG